MSVSKPLVIIAHPHLHDGSRVNARWARELAAHPEAADVRDLYALYPNGALDEAGIAAERAALTSHGLVVFQFPIYWYSCPALLRTWTDEVYGFGWAYGDDAAAPGEPGRMLADKRFACAVSAADEPGSYTPAGKLGVTMEQVLAPFTVTARYVGGEPLAPFAFYRAEGASDEDIDASAGRYLSWLKDLAKGEGARA